LFCLYYIRFWSNIRRRLTLLMCSDVRDFSRSRFITNIEILQFRQNMQSRVQAGITFLASEPAIRCPYFVETNLGVQLIASDVSVDLARLWTSDNVLREMSALKVVCRQPDVIGNVLCSVVDLSCVD